MLHEVENQNESQGHLNANREKFSNHCRRVLELLYSGKRLTGRILETEYAIDGRRLRDIFHARPDIVKKQWAKDTGGKTRFVEYFIEVPKPPTKEKIVKFYQQQLAL